MPKWLDNVHRRERDRLRWKVRMDFPSSEACRVESLAYGQVMGGIETLGGNTRDPEMQRLVRYLVTKAQRKIGRSSKKPFPGYVAEDSW